MANVKISQLSELTTPADADLIPIVDDSEIVVEKSKKITHANYQAGILTHATALPLKIGSDIQVNIKDGLIEPNVNNDIDIGSTSKQFKNVNVKGSIVQNSVTRKMWRYQLNNVSSIDISGLQNYSLKRITLAINRIEFSGTYLYIRLNNDSSSVYNTNLTVYTTGLSSIQVGNILNQPNWALNILTRFISANIEINSIESSLPTVMTFIGIGHDNGSTARTFYCSGWSTIGPSGSISFIFSGNVYGSLIIEELY